MIKCRFFVFLITILLSASVFAQGKHPGGRPGGGSSEKGGVIKVKVVDKTTSGPVEYANVVIFSAKDSSLVTGGVSDSRGIAIIKQIPFGKYYVDVDFIGYIKQRKTDIEITESSRFVDLGTIKLPQAAEMLEDVEVAADRKHIDYKIDKKIVNVSQDLTSTGGSAVDALENVPSIQTDIEGNVQLRGSSSFTVLIDGKPTPLDGSEALQQIPASSIENIEIITNPSAKFDPDGTAGIINIIMKEQEQEGINGKFNATYGSFNAFNGDFLVNARTGKFNFFVGGSYSNMVRRSTNDNIRASIGDTSTLVTKIDGEGDRGHKGYNGRTGFDYYLTDNDIFTVSGEYGNRGFQRERMSEYDQYYTDSNEKPFDDPTAVHSYYVTENGFNVSSDYFSTDLNYQRKFNDSGHELQSYIYYSQRISDEEAGFETSFTDSDYEIYQDSAMQKEKSAEDGESRSWRGKIDYTLPFSEQGKFEAGYQFRSRQGLTDYEYKVWENEAYVMDSSQFNDVDYFRQIHSAYSTYTNSLGKFDFMLGARTEYTDRIFTSIIEDKEWEYNKFDFFPTLHVSRKMAYDIQLQASYTRRIRRPRSWFLDPFKSKMDNNIYRKGNPDLEPAYTDSYELNAQKRFGKHFIALESFYRKTHNKFEHITGVDAEDPNIMIRTFDNVGSDESYGLELMGNLNFFKWWNLNLTADVYQYSLDAMVEDVSTKESTITYSGRLNNTIKIDKTNTRFQITGMYRSPSITAQGERGEFFMINGAVRQQFLDKKLSVMFSVNDIFSTMQFEGESFSDDFYLYHSFNAVSPTFRITVSYILNDYDRRKDRRENEEVEVDTDSMM